LVWRDQDFDAPWCARTTPDESVLFKANNHAVHAGWGDSEKGLHVSLGGRAAMEFGVRVDVGEVLALFVCEGRGQRRIRHGSPFLIGCAQRGAASMNVRYVVELTKDESDQLSALTRGGNSKVRRIKRAQILLAANAGASDEDIARDVGVGTSTVYRTKRRFVEEGLEQALSEEPRPGAPRKLSVSHEALLVATACSTPPQGRAHWTCELLAGQMVLLTAHESISRETIRRRLAALQIKPWQKKMWCIAKVDAEYVARMEDVLELYTEAPNPRRPVVCFDETPRQLIGETRTPIPAAPGSPKRVDYEYRRNGTANLFVFVDAHYPWRHVEVTDRRTSIDFAGQMRALADQHYPHAERIRVVLDNLSTHTPGALYEAFAPEEARRILRRLEFHYTPKHASWLNMAEIEISVLVKECLDRRIPDKIALAYEIGAWELRRNLSGARINWLFSVERAREKLGRAYPRPTNSHTAAA
jgi:transposase